MTPWNILKSNFGLISATLFFGGYEGDFRLRSLFKLSHVLSTGYIIGCRGKKA